MVSSLGIRGFRITNLPRWLVALGALALALLSNAAGAQPDGADEGPAVEPEPLPATPPAVAETKPEEAPREKPSTQTTEWTPAKKPKSLPYRHDGFFFRAAVGGAQSSASTTLPTTDSTLGEYGDATFRLEGGGITLQLAIGATLPSGLVIGGLIHGTVVAAPSYSSELGQRYEGGTMTHSVVGPFLDYYFDPEAGFHLQFAAGLAIVGLNESDDGRLPKENFASISAFGGLVGTGYELFVGRELAMGLLGVAQFHAGNLEGLDTGDRGSVASGALGLLLSVTHH